MSKKIGTSRFKQTEHTNNSWIITCEDGTTEADLLDPAYWSIISARLTPYDTIKVNCDDDSFYAEFLVLKAAANYASVKKLSWHELNDAVPVKESAFSQFEIMNKGPHLKYCVIRKDGGEVLHDKMLKAEAEAWLRDNIKNIAA